MSNITLWSKTANSNNASPPDGFPEGMAPSTVNDACREVMASIRRFVEDGGWFNWGNTYTYISGTSFSVPTDLSATYHAGRRVRAVGSATGTIYGTITSGVYSSVTTVVVVWDSGSLSNETLAISLGYMAAVNPAFSGVGLTGDQTITGVKTFTSFSVTPSAAPTTDYQVANKKFVIDSIPIGVVAFFAHEQASPGMTVRVDAGILFADNNVISVAYQNTGAIAAPSVNPRIDRIVINAITGTVSVLTGAEAGSPNPPVIPVGYYPICKITLATSTLAIINSLITDERIPYVLPSQAYPVNSIHSNLGDDPATELGYGTWVPFPAPAPVLLFPPGYSATYVKATSYVGGNYPHLALDPSNPLTGSDVTSWYTNSAYTQRFHVDMGRIISLRGIYYENRHSSGGYTDGGAKNFTLWGSNDAAAFAELTYAIDTNWTLITTDISQMLQHVSLDQADPHYIIAAAVAGYRYFALKFADNWGSGGNMGIRHLGFQAGAYQWLRTA